MRLFVVRMSGLVTNASQLLALRAPAHGQNCGLGTAQVPFAQRIATHISQLFVVVHHINQNIDHNVKQAGEGGRETRQMEEVCT